MFSWYQDSRSPHNWLKTLLETNEEDGVLSFSSIQAFSMIYFPKMQRQWSLVPKGAVFYTRALRALPSQLEDPVAALSDDVLLAIICMGMYEVVMFDQPTGWLLHYKGLARLAAIRGPRRHQSGSGFAMLPTMRYCITAGYLVERKRCFLGNSEWKAISWMKVGLDSKTPLDKLHDIFCDVPGFLEDRDRLDSWMPNTPGKEEFRAEYCRRDFYYTNGAGNGKKTTQLPPTESHPIFVIAKGYHQSLQVLSNLYSDSTIPSEPPNS